MEEWKPAPGFEGRYEVSNLGRVARTKDGVRTLRKTKGQGRGYHMVCIRADGKPRSVRVHRLVAGAFVAKAKGATTVNHIDGDKNNNRADNLEWASQRANNAHAIDTGLLVKARGEQINTARLTEAEVRRIKALLGTCSQALLAATFGVHHTTICDIAAGRSWKHV